MNKEERGMYFLDDESFFSFFGTEELTVKTLMSVGALHASRLCGTCGEDMACIVKTGKQVFRCNRTACGKREITCRVDSLFYGSRLSCKKIMRLARSWLQGDRNDTAAQSASVNVDSVTHWFAKFRELVLQC